MDTDSKAKMFSDLDAGDARGDRKVHNIPDAEFRNIPRSPKKRKLTNGLAIPVYTASDVDDDGEDIRESFTSTKRELGVRPLLTSANNLLSTHLKKFRTSCFTKYNLSFLFGMILGGLLMMFLIKTFMSTSFVEYLYLAVQKYDGLPDVKRETQNPEPATNQNKTAFEAIIDFLNFV